MKDIEVKKREWVKTAAIVFLAVMLVLTFFSNTIMNRSLPEVAAQYTQSAQINSRIRGSGKVVANESFEVITSQAYTISQVNARLGDEVKTGDVLLTLSQDGSAELEEAQEALRIAELELEKYLVTDSPDNSFAQYHRGIVAARGDLQAAQERQGQAHGRLSQAQAELDRARSELNAFNYSDTAYQNALKSVNNAKAAVEAAATEMEIAERELDTFELNNGGPASALPGAPDPDYHDPSHPLYPTYQDLLQKVNTARANQTEAQNTRDRLIVSTNFTALEAAREGWEAASGKVSAANDAVSDARLSLSDAGRGVTSAQAALDAANEALRDAQKASGTEESLFDIELREKNRAIEELEERISELEAEGDITEIKAAVSGKVVAVNVTAGQQTVPEEPVMVIEVSDMGYTLSISATIEQSTRVSIGDTAEVDRGWWSWGEPINAVLTAIRPDPQNPQTNRLLVFNVNGEDLESDMQLNVTIAQRSENYGIVVPNSAIRSDTNGDFVLVVETRESPLRNRYIATRVDVSVIATDDINSAISGAGLSGWDFVITTSTRPIEPGMQVRLADNS